MPTLDLSWSDYAGSRVRVVESIDTAQRYTSRFRGRELQQTQHTLPANTLLLWITDRRVRAGILLADGVAWAVGVTGGQGLERLEKFYREHGVRGDGEE